jgi:hypothetical protein
VRIGFIGGSYTAVSSNIADEECINWFAESRESTPAVSGAKAFGGQTAGGTLSYIRTPGLKVFSVLPEAPVRGSWKINNRVFVVGGSKLCEMNADGTFTDRGTIVNDGSPVSIAASSIQLLIVSWGSAYCYDLAANTLTDVTASLAGTPGMVKYSDGYFIVNLLNTNKFQISAILDGTTWPGLQVNAVSVFPENIVSIEVNHRELWVFGENHVQPYQDTGSDNIFDVIPGALVETGCAAQNSPCLIDNSVFWIGQDERGLGIFNRSSGYTPNRLSTHAVEIDFQSYSQSQIAQATSYAYQSGGHLFWVLYVPQSSWSWVYDVGEQLWHKRAKWEAPTNGPYTPHRSWNHVYAFGKHLVGDWNSANLYEMSLDFYDDAGDVIRRVRRGPTITNELDRVSIAEFRADFDTGLGPQPPLTDGNGDPRPPQAMLRISRNGGKTWGNEMWKPCGYAGEYNTYVRWQKLALVRRGVIELVVSDPIPWTLTDAYLRSA